MRTEQLLRMNGGDAEFSYADHSLLQRAVISTVKPIVEESIEGLCRTTLIQADCLKIADVGCCSGTNTLLVISHVLKSITNSFRKLGLPPPLSLLAFLNDLPQNDFNTLFRSLPAFYQKIRAENNKYGGNCFVAAMPGSFYGRLFPDNFLHFVHSSYALMWISQVPEGLVTKGGEGLNKMNIYITKTSSPSVFNVYFEQFKRDFTLFLRSRAQELVPGGSMVLTILGSMKSNDPLSIWEFVGLKLYDMVLDGSIEEAKLESFNMPVYLATLNEVKNIIEDEGSFTLKKLRAYGNDWDSYIKQTNNGLDKKARAAIFSSDIRAVGEPILTSHFGQEAVNELFRRFEEDVLDYMEKDKCQFINVVVSLTKKLSV